MVLEKSREKIDAVKREWERKMERERQRERNIEG